MARGTSSEAVMTKIIYFDQFDGKGWPQPSSLKSYFFAPKGHEWFNKSGNDTAVLTLEGIEGTEYLTGWKDRVDIVLSMWGSSDHGMLLIYEKYGGGYNEAYSSKGDMSRIGEWVRTLHGDLRPIGLYIPFSEAWKAVKEFMETDGQLPRSIAWVKNEDLPDMTFPDPHDVVLPGETPARWLSPEQAAAAIARGQGKL